MVKINPDIFREYDIRGIASEDLTPEFVQLLGRAAAAYFQRSGESLVLLGRDNRLSSPSIRDHLAAGLIASGCRVVDIGTVITPIFYYARIHYGINAGIMITASHNPAEFNGFKVALGFGTIHGKEILELSSLAEKISREENPSLVSIDWTQIERKDPVSAYLEMLGAKIKLGPKKLRVVVDCGNGAAGLFAEKFLTGLGCEVIPVFCESDGNFPNHHPDPVKSANLRVLKDKVLKKRADLGIGFDGDGDRLGTVDNKGDIIWGDQLMALYWREILPRYPGSDCIVEVKCSQALVDEIKKLGGKPVFFKTGHSLIKAKMKEIQAVFTGEMSGHMFFADEYYGYDDAFYAAGRLLRMLSNSPETLAELMATLPKYYSTAETRVPCSDRDKFRVVEGLKEMFRKTNEVIDIDGARVLFENGWGLTRASNTQPVIVARCEANSPRDLEAIAAKIKVGLLSFPEVGDFEWEE